MTSESGKAAMEYAKNSTLVIYNIQDMSEEAVVHNLRFMAFTAGERWLLERAREKAIDGQGLDDMWLRLCDLEALFNEDAEK